jgi:hypothetical protein
MWIALHFRRFGIFEHRARFQFSEKPAKVLERMEFRLIGENHAGAIERRNVLDELRLEAEFASQVAVRLEHFGVVVAVPRRMEATGNPLEIAIDLFCMLDLVDLLNGGPAGVPSGLRVVLSKVVDQLVQARVGHVSQMRRRELRVARAEGPALDEDRIDSFLLQQVCGRDAGDSAADDEDVGAKIMGERWKSGKRNSRPPNRFVHGPLAL